MSDFDFNNIEDLSFEENKKVLVLQTCSFDTKYQNYRQKYRVVVAIEQ